MRKSFCDRVKAMELRHENRQINEPVTYVDNETGLVMQVIGNGLAVPAPMTVEQWAEMADKYYRSAK